MAKKAWTDVWLVSLTVDPEYDTQSYTRVQDGVSGYMSHSVAPLYFGLEDAKKATRSPWPGLRVQSKHWPGRSTRIGYSRSRKSRVSES